MYSGVEKTVEHSTSVPRKFFRSPEAKKRRITRKRNGDTEGIARKQKIIILCNVIIPIFCMSVENFWFQFWCLDEELFEVLTSRH